MIKVTTDSVPGENSLPVLQMAIFSLYPHILATEKQGEEQEVYGCDISAYKNTNPIGSGPHVYKFI